MGTTDVGKDQLALIRIEGMHCHRCDDTIRKALTRLPGVHEVEVDFNSGQASVLYDGRSIRVNDLVDGIAATGYKVTGFTQREMDAHHDAESKR